MKHISSKDICLLIRDTLKLTDRRLTDHGSRVGYIVYKMLEISGQFEKFELAEFSFITSIHNLGAYQTDDITQLFKTGNKDVMSHSSYGYLFMKHLFPVPEYAKILLYHHMDYNRMGNVEYNYKYISGFIHFADELCIHMGLKENFDYRTMKKDAGTKYAPLAYERFEQAEKKYGVLNNLKTDEFKKEMDQLLDYVMFRNDEKKKYLEMLMYCIGFRNNYGVVDAVTTICISEEIGKKLHLSQEEQDVLYYGSLMHDIGMLTVSQEIREAPRKLTKEEVMILRGHVRQTETLLRKRFRNQEIVDVAVRHHERLDGSGYPRGLKFREMKKLDFVLQIADVVCGLTNIRSYRLPRNKEEVIQILSDEARNKRLDRAIVDIYIRNYDEIMQRVKTEADRILVTYSKIQKQYNVVRKKF